MKEGISPVLHSRMIRSLVLGGGIAGLLLAHVSGCGGDVKNQGTTDGGGISEAGLIDGSTGGNDAGLSKPDAGGSTGMTGTQSKSDKVDLLFAVDNSFSMSDKQSALAAAVPDLVARLVTPNCVDGAGNANGSQADPTKPAGMQCATGTPEFAPVSDIHIAIVSSSLGAFGDKTICADTSPQNDHGQLLNRTTIADAPAGFLAWFPTVAANAGKPGPIAPTPAITSTATLIKDFQDVVTGIGQNGCGLEAQLESWYHFLVAPDPWAQITIGNDNVAKYTGIDATIVQQRHDFLRPDSLVAVLMLTDEDDSFADPLSIGGEGWAFSVSNFPQSPQARSGGNGTTAPLPTTTCATKPTDPACTTCGFAPNCNPSDPACQAIKNDANCKSNGGYYAGDSDSLNVRYFHMKQRFGVDPQYPTERYSHGLSHGNVPKGSEEHNNAGVYQTAAGSCQNPLFAAKLPATIGDEFCHLGVGPRSPSLVFFAIIGGVPNELLHFDPTNPAASKLSAADWTKIIGQNPAAYDYTGVDQHMLQSTTPRPGLPAPSMTAGDNGTDPIHGREWDTKKNDLQFACTFPLEPAGYKTCPAVGDATCADCDGLTNAPLCGVNPLQQIRAKAYPTLRPLRVAHDLGDQGVAASLCTRTVNLDGITPEPAMGGTGPNPLYGYRPAVKSILDHLKPALTP